VKFGLIESANRLPTRTEKKFGKRETEEFGEQSDRGGDFVRAHWEPVRRLSLIEKRSRQTDCPSFYAPKYLPALHSQLILWGLFKSI